jgi:hypothetical protein
LLLLLLLLLLQLLLEVLTQLLHFTGGLLVPLLLLWGMCVAFACNEREI